MTEESTSPTDAQAEPVTRHTQVSRPEEPPTLQRQEPRIGQSAGSPGTRSPEEFQALAQTIGALKEERDALVASATESNLSQIDEKFVELEEKIAELEAGSGYRLAVVTFIDILGFREMVTSGTDPARVYDVVRAFRNRGTPASIRHKLHQKEHGIEVYHFSDSIVRVSPLVHPAKAEPRGAVFSEIAAMAFIQSYLIEEGVLIRGAITLGEIFANGNLLFGPAMIRAYDLESKIANYPRVIVDPNVIHNIEVNPDIPAPHRAARQEKEWVSDLLAVDFDGIPFVDYIDPLPGLKYSYPAQHAIERHKEIIEAELAKGKPLGRVSAKYNWMAQYHNRKMAELDAKRGSSYSRWLVDLSGVPSTFVKIVDHLFPD